MALSLFSKSSLAVKTMGGAMNPMRSVVAATFHTSTFTCQATPATPQWTTDSVRTGVIAKKKGMTSVWSETGIRMPVTVLQVNDLHIEIMYDSTCSDDFSLQLEDVVVTDVRTEEKHGYTALQVGCSPKKEKNVPKPMIEHFKSLGVGLREKLYEFRVTKDAVLPIGTELTAEHFVTGQYVDVTAPS